MTTATSVRRRPTICPRSISTGCEANVTNRPMPE
jgi:hypothetical protein